MVKKIYLAIFLAGIFFNPSRVISGTPDIFDQFTDALNIGLFQGVLISSELILESDGDTGTIQGVNIISGYYFDGEIIQKAIIEEDLSLVMTNGNDVTQGVNIYRGGAVDEIAQVAIIEGSVIMRSRNSNNGIQGINIITECVSCN